MISLCADGVKKTGPTTFVVEKTDYTPDRDLEVLVVGPDGTRLGPGEAGDLYFRNLMGIDFEYHKADAKTEAAEARQKANQD